MVRAALHVSLLSVRYVRGGCVLELMFAGGHHRWSRQWEPPESCGRLRSCRDLGQRLDPGWLRSSLLCTAVGHSRSTAKCLLLAVTNVTLWSVAIFVCHKLTFYLCASFGPLGPTHMALTLPGFPRLTRPRTQEQKFLNWASRKRASKPCSLAPPKSPGELRAWSPWDPRAGDVVM